MVPPYTTTTPHVVNGGRIIAQKCSPHCRVLKSGGTLEDDYHTRMVHMPTILVPYDTSVPNFLLTVESHSNVVNLLGSKVFHVGSESMLQKWISI